MKQLQTGQFHGQTHKTIHLEGVTLTDTEYTQSEVDWHYHENAYFTFILQGQMLEGNKKETYYCSAGSLLFHNWQDAHYNTKPPGFTRGFHIELQHNWLNQYPVNRNNLQGSMQITLPGIKLLVYRIFKEVSFNNPEAAISIQALILQTLSQLSGSLTPLKTGIPNWVLKTEELLRNLFCEPISLQFLAQTAGVHPVHLSRYFPKYFHCGVGEYIRKLKVEKALGLLPDRQRSLTEIAFECGFADQSHFTRCFRQIQGITPSGYRSLFPVRAKPC